MSVPNRLRNLATSVLPFGLIGRLWQVFGADSGPRSIFLPTPVAVAKALISLFTDTRFYADIGWRIYRVTFPFVFSVGLAITIRILAGPFRSVAVFVHPINDFTRHLPVASL